MDDSEIVAAVAAGDPAGLAAAYDRYAAPLYGYCRWMLGDPPDAAQALRETFAAAAKLDTLDEPAALRAWLYTTARAECHRRLRGPGSAFDETAGAGGGQTAGEGGGQTAGAGQHDQGSQRAEVQRLIRETLAELEPDEHEAIELNVRQNLDDAEIAAVLGVSWSRAHALTALAREHLETTLGALLVARTGRQSCPELAGLLADWDGHLTVPIGKLTARHMEHCQACADRRHGTLRPEVLAGLLPPAPLPAGLREPVLQRAGARASDARRVAGRSGLLRAAMALRWSSIRAHPGTATALAAVTLWVVAAMSATLITVSGLHAARALAAPARSAPAPTPTPAVSRPAPASPSPSLSPSPTRATQPPADLQSTFEPAPSASPSKSAKPKPSTSPSASPSASVSPSASASASPTASPTPTPSIPPRPTPTPTVGPALTATGLPQAP